MVGHREAIAREVGALDQLRAVEQSGKSSANERC